MTSMNLPEAITSEKIDNNASDKYVKIKTMDAVNILVDNGYEIRKAAVQGSRTRDPELARHSVILRPENYRENSMGLRPEIILTNSSNRTVAFKMQAGLFRFVCENGLVIGKTLGEIKARHIHTTSEEVLDMVGDVMTLADNGLKRAADMSDIILSEDQKMDFADRVLNFWPLPHLKPEQLLEARRSEDKGDDLFRVYNVIQENITKGGIRFTTETKNKSGEKRMAQTRGITAITNDINFNSKLWNLTEELMEAA